MSHIITKSLPSHSDHIYSTKHGVQLPLRIFPCTESSPDTPWFLYIHGGAFMTGQHFYPSPWWLELGKHLPCHVVSIGYRLSPHVSFDEMVQDCLDAFDWIQSNLAQYVDGINLARYAIGGSSAGGTLVLSLASRQMGKLAPPPAAVVNLFGLSDFTDPFFYDSTPVLPTDVVPLSGEFTPGQLDEGMYDRDPSHALTFMPNFLDTPEEELRRGWETDMIRFDEKTRFQLDLRYHVRTKKRLLNVFLREETFHSSVEFEHYRASVSPLETLDDSFPPTIILHGEADTVVPIDHSRLVAEKLRQLGREVREIYVPHMPHGFDRKFVDESVEGWSTEIQPIIDFVRSKLGLL